MYFISGWTFFIIFEQSKAEPRKEKFVVVSDWPIVNKLGLKVIFLSLSHFISSVELVV